MLSKERPDSLIASPPNVRVERKKLVDVVQIRFPFFVDGTAERGVAHLRVAISSAACGGGWLELQLHVEEYGGHPFLTEEQTLADPIRPSISHSRWMSPS